ncbi:Meprin A subunit beta [Triplophysa tibetana]|uniref:Metalloendopeptidase n=1 Tax=Triplophysa tibetana TaxID=1572043 RepID=A0A5A9NI61_9TELE|nr:Meprin A subunit beta [Triplophysa tibetana]
MAYLQTVLILSFCATSLCLTQSKNAILGEKYRWPTTVPYFLDKSLEINAKGVILKAFEQYRLKTCIDFKEWNGEPNYISVYKGSGCHSSVGNRQVGKQELSIGANCDRLGTVEHEFLHALGFWHEQSRYDRDDYVVIMWDQIEEGHAHNFEKHSDKVSTSLGVPYDYNSVLHYSKTSFNKDKEPTIVTKIPEFMDVIGQRMEFSDSDVLKLNRLYNCSAGLTFLDSCQFEQPNICGMIQGEGVNAKWTRVQSAEGGPKTDFTVLGQCQGFGYFMHFSTLTGNHGDKAYLESRLFYPTRGFQCLQFYHYNSGGDDDQLNIWVRVYTDEESSGDLRLVEAISGGPKNSWELYHVSLQVSQKFRVVFEGVKGRHASKGGLSLDDINLSETQCPHHTWRIRDFSSLLSTTPVGSKIFSPPFLSREGYSFQVSLYINGKTDSPDKMAIYFHLTSGPNDEHLKWPCPWQQASLEMMDQTPDIQKRMNNQRMVTTDPKKTSTDSAGNVEYYWDDPRKVGSQVTDSDGNSYYRGPGYGTTNFITHEHFKSRSFIKGNDVIFLLSLEDATGLLKQQLAEFGIPDIRDLKQANDDSVTASNGSSTATLAISVFVSAAMFMAVALGALYYVQRVRKRQMEREAEPERTDASCYFGDNVLAVLFGLLRFKSKVVLQMYHVMKIFAVFKRSRGTEDGNTHSTASSSRCSSSAPSLSVAHPAPDKHQKSGHHRMTGSHHQGYWEQLCAISNMRREVGGAKVHRKENQYKHVAQLI